MNGAIYTYEMENEIRGYHVYGSSWKPKISDFLLNDREVSNEDDNQTSLQWLFTTSLASMGRKLLDIYQWKLAELQPIL